MSSEFERQLDNYFRAEKITRYIIVGLSVLLILFAVGLPASATEVNDDGSYTEFTSGDDITFSLVDNGDPDDGDGDAGESDEGTGSGDNGGDEQLETLPEATESPVMPEFEEQEELEVFEGFDKLEPLEPSEGESESILTSTGPTKVTLDTPVITDNGSTYWVPALFKEYKYVFIWEIASSNYTVMCFDELIDDGDGTYSAESGVAANIPGGLAAFVQGATATLETNKTFKSEWYGASYYKAANFDLGNGITNNIVSIGSDSGETPDEPSEDPSEDPSDEPSEEEKNLLKTLEQTNELLQAIYVALLFVIGVVAAVFVVVLLYKFLRSCF